MFCQTPGYLLYDIIVQVKRWFQTVRFFLQLVYESVYYVYWFQVGHDQSAGFHLVVLLAGFEGIHWLHILRIPTRSLQNIIDKNNNHRSTIIVLVH